MRARLATGGSRAKDPIHGVFPSCRFSRFLLYNLLRTPLTEESLWRSAWDKEESMAVGVLSDDGEQPLRAEIVLYQADGANVPVSVRSMNDTMWVTYNFLRTLTAG